MATTTLLQRESLSVIDYRCSVAPSEKPFVELHDSFSISYVRKGSFGYRTRGKSFDLVAGSLLLDPDGNNVEAVCLQ